MAIDFFDSQQALGFIQPQLLRIETAVYQIKYPSFDYSQFMFVNTSGDMWDAGTMFYAGDIAGKAEYFAAGAFDVPMASISRTQFLRENHLAGVGYEWNLEELKRAERLGRPLGSEKAQSCSKVAESFIYNIAIRGSVEKNQTGLINDPNVPVANVAATGTAGATTWASKTPDAILADINLALNTPFTNTRETQIGNSLILPTTKMQAISTMRIGTDAGIGTSDTVLKFIKENNYYTLTTGQPLTIKASRELETAGVNGSARMIAYDNSQEVIQFHLPGPHTFLTARQKGALTWEVPGIMNVGGTEIRLPKAVAYYDGI